MSLLIGAGIAGNVIGDTLTNSSRKKENRKSRDFQREMFDKTNEYNTALNQRRRIEEAGLNPNMLYGGSPGSVAGTADQPGMPQFESADWSSSGNAVATGINDVYQRRSVQAGTEVNEERAKNIAQDTKNKGIDALIKSVDASGKQLDYRQKKELYDTTVKSAMQNLTNLGITGDNLQAKNAREERVVDETVKKMQLEMSNLREQGKVLSEDALYKRVENELWQKFRINRQDNVMWRIGGDIMGQLMQYLGIPSNAVKP